MSETELARLAEDFPAWADHFGVELYPWQRQAFGGATQRDGGKFKHRLAGVSVARGNGKSFAAAAVSLWRLLFAAPPVLVLTVALDHAGSGILLAHGKTLVRQVPAFEDIVEVRADELRVPDTGSRWILRSRDHLSSRGLHPDVITIDEAGWMPTDELFSSLLASQASVVDPLMMLISTVARPAGPLWMIQQMTEAGDRA